MKLAWLASLLVIASAPAPSAAQQRPPQQDHWRLVDEGLGRAGVTQPDGVRRYSFPRSDLSVRLDGVTLKPALALGSWLAFHQMGKQASVMGDLVLTHDEVNPVIRELLAGGLKVTALHNHLLRSEPATMYLHVEGRGDPWTLAVALRKALAKSRTPLAATPPAAPAALDLDTAALDRLLGKQGRANGGVYQFTFPRAERVSDAGMDAGASMGTGTVINFQPVGNGKAAINGDFVLLAEEVDGVMRSLSANGIEVTALHSHMLREEPRLFFMHFWAVDEAARLASALRSALALSKVRA
jgi:hypothetical protein